MRLNKPQLKTPLLIHIRYVLFLFALYLSPASAHPHYWISVQSEFFVDEQGNLEQIKQRWAFDQFYSMMTIADLLNEHKDPDVGLEIKGNQLIYNLIDFEYFSALSASDKPIKLGFPTEHRLIKKAREGQQILELEMTHSFDATVNLFDQEILWMVYDPTFFIAVNHNTDNNITVNGIDHKRCQITLEKPTPTDDLIEFALELDGTQRDTVGLGVHFAERIHVSCTRSLID